MAFALGGAALAQGQKSRQPRPCGKVGWQGQPFHGAVGQDQPRACDQLGQGRIWQGRGTRLAREMRHGLAAGVVGHML